MATINESLVLDESHFDPSLCVGREQLIRDLFIGFKKAKCFSSGAKVRDIASKVMLVFSEIGNQFIKSKLDINLKDAFENIFDDETSSLSLREDFLEQINVSERKIVFLENLDRCSADNILLIFKLLRSVLDVPNTVYVLVYDKQRMTDIFKNSSEVNDRYFEKIISQIIAVPVLSDFNRIHVVDLALGNLVKLYDESNMAKYNEIIHLLSVKVKDLRCLKRMINSAYYKFYINKCKYLDQLFVDCIEFIEPELWQIINENRNIFYVANEPKNEQEAFDIVENYKIDHRDYLKQISETRKEVKDKYWDYDFLMKKIFPVYKLKEARIN